MFAAESTTRVKVLCVDDEPAVLEGLALNLRKSFDVVTQSNPVEALEMLKRDPDIAIIVSDMKMPEMNGATLLKSARDCAPETVRILLTGHSEIDTAIAAVNNGQIFRFLTKPCSPHQLMATMNAAVLQYRVKGAEREVLERTLLGSMAAMTDVLELLSPPMFGRSARVKMLVSILAKRMGLGTPWELEAAAGFAQVGYAALPREISEKMSSKQRLDASERQLVLKSVQTVERVLARIPRMDAVRAIILSIGRPPIVAATDPRPMLIVQGSAILRVVFEFDLLHSQGLTTEECVQELTQQPEQFDEDVVRHLAECAGSVVSNV